MSRALRLLFVPLLALLLLYGAPSAGAQIPVVGDLPITEAPAPTSGGDTSPAPGGAPESSSNAAPLVGTFRISAGNCTSNLSGSFFRMIQPGGSATGPFVTNSDSPCGDKSYTPLRPGTDGGLVTRSYQAQPASPFDAAGNGKSARITAPAKFYGVDFATATNATDPQTGAKVAAPEIQVSGTSLSGDTRAFAASWNNQHFNQGAPKPDGSTPGNTKRPSGTIDPNTGAFTLEWSSLIVGGPFNNFTGVWRLEGQFVSSEAAASSGGSAAPATGAADPGLASAVAASTQGGAGARTRGVADTRAGPESIVGGVLLLAGLAAGRLRRRVAVAGTTRG
ncbi:MAG TPA: hypothetical protein VMY88_06205 [Acidimicrobiales bacterium]|nr:hypothetical protein [Acidimicrobiales bacterium]